MALAISSGERRAIRNRSSSGVVQRLVEVADREDRAATRQLADRPRQHRLLDCGERPAEHAGDEAGGQPLAGQQGVVRVAVAVGLHRVELVAAARLQLDDRDAQPVGQRRVLALGVQHGDEPVRVDGPGSA